jgi:hypothetical protein
MGSKSPEAVCCKRRNPQHSLHSSKVARGCKGDSSLKPQLLRSNGLFPREIPEVVGRIQAFLSVFHSCSKVFLVASSHVLVLQTCLLHQTQADRMLPHRRSRESSCFPSKKKRAAARQRPVQNVTPRFLRPCTYVILLVCYHVRASVIAFLNVIIIDTGYPPCVFIF